MKTENYKTLEEAFQWLREAKVFIKQNIKSPSDLLLLEAIEDFTEKNDTNYICPYCGEASANCNPGYPHPKIKIDDYDGAVAELQAVIDSGQISTEEYEELEADICKRIFLYWMREIK